jgi:hypothetical protein
VTVVLINCRRDVGRRWVRFGANVEKIIDLATAAVMMSFRRYDATANLPATHMDE